MNTIQKRAYASEAEENFRWIAGLLATRSKDVLTSVHLADDAIYSRISDMGEYAEIAHGSISPSFVFRDLNELCRPGFPLESYKALKNDGAHFVKQFTGSVADVQGFVAFRPHMHQLVVAFSGTSSFSQTLRDIRSWRTAYPLDSGRSTVHSGFWDMYQGLQRPAFEALRAGFQEHGSTVKEVALTGHSMGCTMCYLLALDLMAEVEGVTFPHGLKLNVTTFGSPRLGNAGLADYWRESINHYLSRFGDDSFREYSVKGYNDGTRNFNLWFRGYDVDIVVRSAHVASLVFGISSPHFVTLLSLPWPVVPCTASWLRARCFYSR
jgi:Lipase (class 3)